MPDQPELYDYVILPLLIFCARVIDVSIGTIRIVYVARGKRFIAPLLGFFEIMIWVLAVTRIMQNLDNWVCYFAYALGFATGNFIGLIIEDKLSVGEVVYRIITPGSYKQLMAYLNAAGFGATGIKAEGSESEVYVIYSIVKRSDMKRVAEIIHQSAPEAFYTVEDIKLASKAMGKYTTAVSGKIPLLKRWRKGK